MSNYDYITIPDDDGDMDNDYENSNNSNFRISNAMGEYNQDDDSYFESSRRNQLYWTPEATKDLIRLRGERESEFEMGGARKSQLWIDICRKMRELGHDFSAEKVSKKWHNIMITYNKNIHKKMETGNVNWDFFEEIDAIYKNKRMQDYEPYQYDDNDSPPSVSMIAVPTMPIIAQASQLPAITIKRRSLLQPAPPPLAEPKYYDNDKLPKRKFSNPPLLADLDDPDVEFKKFKFNVKPDVKSEPPSDDSDQSWWKEYLETKLELEREKMKREHERHKDNMNFQKMALMLQEKAVKLKIDAMNSLTNAITNLAESNFTK